MAAQVANGTCLQSEMRMLSNTLPSMNSESEAHRLVGMFLQSFSLLEQALDAGIGKLLGLEGGKNDIVCSSIPFAKKVGVFFSAEGLLGSMPDQQRTKKLKATRGAILELNNQRVMFAHNPFSANGSGGVSFQRVVADKKLDVSTIVLTSKEVDELSTKAKEIVIQLEELVSEMKPYVPSLDFSDPRNSMYAFLLL